MHLRPLGFNAPSRLLSSLYGHAVSVRNKWYDRSGRAHTACHPVISIGAIHAGGTGKTTITSLIAAHLVEQGCEVAVLTRGYGRRHRCNTVLRPGQRDPWHDIGDEPAMLQRRNPDIWLGIGAKRYVTAAGISPHLGSKAVFLLDDGFQHRQLHRDIDIVCLPPDPFHDHLLPAGTMREPLSSLARADIMCLIGTRDDKSSIERSRRLLLSMFPSTTVVVLFQEVDRWINLGTGEETEHLPLRNPVLLSGIARPQRFVRLVAQSGIVPCCCTHYEDHHPFTAAEIGKQRLPDSDGIITTEKDSARLSTIKLVNRSDIWYLSIRLEFAEPDARRQFLDLVFRP